MCAVPFGSSDKEKSRGATTAPPATKQHRRKYTFGEGGQLTFTEKGVTYTRTGQKDYINRFGQSVILDIFTGACRDCGRSFEVYQVRKGFTYFKRRCPSCIFLRKEARRHG